MFDYESQCNDDLHAWVRQGDDDAPWYQCFDCPERSDDNEMVYAENP